MDKREIKKKAEAFLLRYISERLTLERMVSILRDQGFTLVQFNNIYNDEDVSAIITELKLSDMTDKLKGFTYVDKNHRLVFLHEDLSKDEKLLVLAHEEGHIFCEHFGHSAIIGKDVAEEFEANEFAHYILNPTIPEKSVSFIKRHKIISIAVITVIALGIFGCFGISQLIKEESYYGEYYVTSTGNKYHEEDCIFVKNKTNVHRLTKEEFESGEYEPCQICLP